MMIKPILIVALAILASAAIFADAPTHAAGWRSFLHEQIPLLGHRNWIVVADSAYPAQISPGVVTIETNVTQIEAVQEVLRELGASRHVTPILYVDAELKSLTDTLA